MRADLYHPLRQNKMYILKISNITSIAIYGVLLSFNGPNSIQVRSDSFALDKSMLRLPFIQLKQHFNRPNLPPVPEIVSFPKDWIHLLIFSTNYMSC